MPKTWAAKLWGAQSRNGRGGKHCPQGALLKIEIPHTKMIGGFLPSLRLRCQSAILANPPGAGTSCFQGKVNVLSSGARGQCAQRARSTGLHASCCASFSVRHSRTLRLPKGVHCANSLTYFYLPRVCRKKENWCSNTYCLLLKKWNLRLQIFGLLPTWPWASPGLHFYG